MKTNELRYKILSEMVQAIYDLGDTFEEMSEEEENMQDMVNDLFIVAEGLGYKVELETFGTIAIYTKQGERYI